MTLFMDGFDEAIEGLVEPMDGPPLVVYSEEKILQMLAEQFGDYAEAMDHYYFNIAGAYMGEGTPLIMTPMDRATIEEYFNGN